MFLSEWREFPLVPCLAGKKKLYDSSRLDVVEIARVPYMLPSLFPPFLQLVKKFPAFHRTRRFITALTSVRHLFLSWASTIQSIYPHPTSRRFVLILSTHLRLGLSSGLLPSGFFHTMSLKRHFREKILLNTKCVF